MEVISKDAAEQEVGKWLDSLDIDKDRREDPILSEVIRNIVKAVMKGLWVINDDDTVTQCLQVPLGENGVTKSITYSRRYTIGAWHDKLKKLQSNDNLAMIFAKLSLLSGEHEAVFKKMDKRDYDVASNVAVFF